MMSIDRRAARKRRPIAPPAMLAMLAMLAGAASAPARTSLAAAPISDDESLVSTGSWLCHRYAAALSAGGSAAAADVVSVVRSFALGYVYGVSEAVGKPFPEAVHNDRRIIELLGRGCSEDTARAVRDATLLAGRAMLEDARSLDGSPAAGATGSLACRAYLDAPGAGPVGSTPVRTEQVRNWADGYINARFERAGRGLIPTAKNKALMLERFSAACAARPSGTVREAARSVVDGTLPGK